jgi:hypothetical protein
MTPPRPCASPNWADRRSFKIAPGDFVELHELVGSQLTTLVPVIVR